MKVISDLVGWSLIRSRTLHRIQLAQTRSSITCDWLAHGQDHGTYERLTLADFQECGGICAIPKGKVILATVRPDSFDLLPMDPNTRCTELSVAAHTLYEKSELHVDFELITARPDLLAGPGGLLDLTQAKYEQISERGVRVSGALIRPAPTTFKLEGACRVGYKTVFICGIRDPILIAGIEDFVRALIT